MKIAGKVPQDRRRGRAKLKISPAIFHGKFRAPRKPSRSLPPPSPPPRKLCKWGQWRIRNWRAMVRVAKYNEFSRAINLTRMLRLTAGSTSRHFKLSIWEKGSERESHITRDLDRSMLPQRRRFPEYFGFCTRVLEIFLTRSVPRRFYMFRHSRRLAHRPADPHIVTLSYMLYNTSRVS